MARRTARVAITTTNLGQLALIIWRCREVRCHVEQLVWREGASAHRARTRLRRNVNPARRCRKGSPLIALPDLAMDFAAAVTAADAKRPVAINQHTGVSFQPGIGPHSELRTVRLVVEEMQAAQPERYPTVMFDIPYPDKPRQKCDLVLGEQPDRLYVEAKLLRILGDNGKLNDNMLMHILSPYPQHRSAVTDCEKLRTARFPGRSAILIFGLIGSTPPSIRISPAGRSRCIQL